MLSSKIFESIENSGCSYTFNEEVYAGHKLLQLVDKIKAKIDGFPVNSIVTLKSENPVYLLSGILACLNQKIHCCSIYYKSSRQFAVEQSKDLSAIAFLDLDSDEVVKFSENKLHELSEPCVVFRTSGSTGDPKYIFKTESSIYLNCEHSGKIQEIGEQSHILNMLPLSHVGGLCLQVLPGLLKRSNISFANRWSNNFFFSISNYFSHTTLVPSQLTQIIRMEKIRKSDCWLNSLDRVITGSTRVENYIIDWAKTKSVPLVGVYGSTEIGPLALLNSNYLLGSPKETCIGRPVEGVEAKIVNDILFLRGHGAGLKVLERKELKHLAIEDNWISTGDIVRFNQEDQNYYYSGREGRAFFSSGFLIIPEEIEATLEKHKLIEEAWVEGQNHDIKGKTCVAYIKILGDVGVSEMRGFLSRFLETYKIPQKFIAVSDLPRSAINKKIKLKNIL